MTDRENYIYFFRCALLYSTLHVIGRASALVGYFYKNNTINLSCKFDKTNAFILVFVSLLFLYLYIKDPKGLKKLMTISFLYIILEIIGKFFFCNTLFMLMLSIVYFFALIACGFVDLKINKIDAKKKYVINRNVNLINKAISRDTEKLKIKIIYRFQHAFKYKIKQSLYWSFFTTFVLIGFFINDLSLLGSLGSLDGIIKNYLLVISIVSMVVVVMYSLPSVVVVFFKNKAYIRIAIIEYNKKRVLRLMYGSDKHIINREIEYLKNYKNSDALVGIIRKFKYE